MSAIRATDARRDPRAHIGHVIEPHIHVWQLHYNVPVYKGCSGKFFCRTDSTWFDGEQCPAPPMPAEMAANFTRQPASTMPPGWGKTW
jgi:hypothetical protein